MRILITQASLGVFCKLPSSLTELQFCKDSQQSVYFMDWSPSSHVWRRWIRRESSGPILRLVASTPAPRRTWREKRKFSLFSKSNSEYLLLLSYLVLLIWVREKSINQHSICNDRTGRKELQRRLLITTDGNQVVVFVSGWIGLTLILAFTIWCRLMKSRPCGLPLKSTLG